MPHSLPEEIEIAVKNGDSNKVKSWFKTGMVENVNCLENSDGYNLLQLAMQNTNDTKTSMLDLLIKNGCDINQRNSNGDTVFHFEICQQDTNIENVKALTDRGADINLPNSEGESVYNFVKTEKPNIESHIDIWNSDPVARENFHEKIANYSGALKAFEHVESLHNQQKNHYTRSNIPH